ncbi:MAG TPA: hypothetical protein PKM65_07485 [Spirochaetota bacterium]|nr:hypothetical protein [Spirochaetota bacterium]HNT09798.1 hypothetical protein [Spirochaetota bacterium]HOS40507.1 hypothetical protein [Spirochaetota bacterium]
MLARIALIAALAVSSPAIDFPRRVPADETLAVPGVGAERIVVGDAAPVVIGRLGVPDAKAQFPERRELFRDVLLTPAPITLFFTAVYEYRTRRVAVFMDRDRVTAIVARTTGRVTPESVSLARGVEYFIFTYGNAGMHAIAKPPANTLFLYPRLGIGIVDDKNDDTIDMFIIFAPTAP